ncbi:MAG: acyl-[acyl-carrier-protein]-phospholipid O-acyltransferase [Mariniblastus sp.]|jgi:acyl-[acyl-carrier-protein]-phospholipid O-acyltransferase/long-chain-fatty-acid--[acyl-carrier-protein] ligase
MNSASSGKTEIPNSSSDAANKASSEFLDQEAPTTSGGLWSASFQGLLWTQWLTAVNDNVFRWFVIGVGKNQFAPEDQAMLLVVGSSCFIFPYIIFASVAGWLADRFAKRKVIIGCKIAEIVIMGIGVLAVSWLGKPNPGNSVDPYFWVLLGAVFFMGMQSALFAPAKVGTIPELLTEKTIAAGNGIFNLVTLSATVIGMALGGWLSDHTLRGQVNLGTAALVLVGIAVVGTLLSFLVWTLPAANKKAKFPIYFWLMLETIRDILQLFSFRILFRIAIGISFFWAIAAFAQLNIDLFAQESGGLLESDRTPLLIAVVLGIGLGSVFAGIVSNGRIELGLVPLGAIGIGLFAFLLWFSPENFIDENTFNTNKILVCLLLGGLGFSAGIFDVPLASFLQHNSPVEKRGSMLAATNCLAFSGILLMFGVMLLCGRPGDAGSLANLAPELTSANLSNDQQAELKAITTDYKSAELDGKNANLAGYLTGVSPEVKKAAVTELVFLDSQRRREAGKTLTFQQYRNEFGFDSTENASSNPVVENARIGRQIKQAISQSGRLPWLNSRQIFLVMSILTLPVIFYALYRLLRPTLRLLFELLMRTLYRVKITGAENIPHDGAAVVVVNHSSWLDGALLLVFVPRLPRAIAWAGNFSSWLMRNWAKLCGIILISGGPKSIRKGLKDAREALAEGEVVALFPEGGISQDCQIKSFKPGLTKIVDKSNPEPIIPVYFDELWGSVYSYSGGKALWKFPNSIRRPLSVHIGKPIEKTDSLFEIRQAVQELSATTMKNYSGPFVSAASSFIKACKKSKFRSKIADSTQQEETGGKLLTRALILRKLLRREVLDQNEQHVAVLIPPSVGGAIVNVALAMDRRVAVNLNYSLSNELINHCIEDAGVKTVLTTRKVADKFKFEFDCKVFYLDDLKDKVSGFDKAMGAFQAFAVPAFCLNRMLGLHKIKPDDPLTIVFTSGSTGVPKGVILTEQNVMSNVHGIEKVASLVATDTLVGVLPFFHSMGYTVTLWGSMSTAIRGVYHFNPLDSKIVGKLTEKYSGTIIVATPTFLRSYTRRCTSKQFKSLEMVITGAERLPPELCEEFEQKFGVRPVEGYGTTELSPVACVNIPYARQSGKKFQVDAKEGTVGRPMPNCAAKITDLDTGEQLGPNQAGMLWITGPNVMQGYLNKPEATAEVLQDGWYKTGDVAIIDDDGFVKITGRMSRFSKIGGEMVPHLKIEEILTRLLDTTPNDDSDDHLLVAVTAVPNDKKGERLIVLHTNVAQSAEEMQQALKADGLPNIFIPSLDSFIQVDSLPLLGTGKLDLRGIKDLALEKTKEN